MLPYDVKGTTRQPLALKVPFLKIRKRYPLWGGNFSRIGLGDCVTDFSCIHPLARHYCAGGSVPSCTWGPGSNCPAGIQQQTWAEKLWRQQ